MRTVELSARLCHDSGMARRNHAAGGFFLILAIFAGFAWGAMSGMPFEGAVIGTIVGIVLAVIVWLVDRRRG